MKSAEAAFYPILKVKSFVPEEYELVNLLSAESVRRKIEN